MADNIPITAGAGTTVATDDVGGIHYQFVKLADGTLDSSNKLVVDSTGAALTDQRNSGTATVASKASSATDITLLASNTARRGAIIYNNSTQILYVNLGGVATTTTAFVVAIGASGYYEVPFGYTGVIHGIWASANGAAQVTEITT